MPDTNAASYEFLDLSRDGAVATLRLNRPDTLNAWNLQMREEMRDAVRALVEDDDLRAVIVTGTGRAFSAGEDVRGMGDLSAVGPRGFRRRVRMIHNVFDEIEQMELPVIAAINGVAAGGGCELALSCDFRFAADNARLGLPENNVGLIPGSGGISASRQARRPLQGQAARHDRRDRASGKGARARSRRRGLAGGRPDAAPRANSRGFSPARRRSPSAPPSS